MQEQEDWNTTGSKEELVEKAKEAKAKYLKETTATSPTSTEEALKMLAPSLVTAPSGVTYSIKKLSSEGLAMFMGVLKDVEPGEEERKVGFKLIADLSDFEPLIYQHIIEPKLPIEAIPGGDFQYLSTHLMFEISGVVDKPADSFREK